MIETCEQKNGRVGAVRREPVLQSHLIRHDWPRSRYLHGRCEV